MTLKERLLEWLIRPERYYIRKYLRLLRKEERYTFDKPCRLLSFWYKALKNRLGARLGFIISAGCFAEGLQLEHYGSVIVNPKARIGRNCKMVIIGSPNQIDIPGMSQEKNDFLLSYEILKPTKMVGYVELTKPMRSSFVADFDLRFSEYKAKHPKNKNE